MAQEYIVLPSERYHQGVMLVLDVFDLPPASGLQGHFALFYLATQNFWPFFETND